MNLRLSRDTHRGEQCHFLFEGTRVRAYRGETIAAALIAEGQRRFRADSLGGARGPYCNMGTCFECVVQIRVAGGLCGDGEWRLARACLTGVGDGLEVRSIDNFVASSIERRSL